MPSWCPLLGSVRREEPEYSRARDSGQATQELGRSGASKQSSALPVGSVSASGRIELCLKAAVPEGAQTQDTQWLGSSRKDRAIPAG